MRHLFSMILAVAYVGLAGQALALDVDMSKLTCKQVGDMSPGKTIGVAMWVNGYVHGKMGKPTIDSDQAHANAEKVVDYCKSNPGTTLSDAIEAIAKS